MEVSPKIARYDDNTLFRFLSKSYCKDRKSSLKRYSELGVKTSNQLAISQSLPMNKFRSQTSTTSNSFSFKGIITPNPPTNKLGFLKYRRFSKHQEEPLNFNIMKNKNNIQFAKTISLNSHENMQRSSQLYQRQNKQENIFGLRSAINKTEHQTEFRYSQDEYSMLSNVNVDNFSLTKKTNNFLTGQKKFNINSFLSSTMGKKTEQTIKLKLESTFLRKKYRKKVKQPQRQSQF